MFVESKTGRLTADKHLRPVVSVAAAGGVTDPDLVVIRVKDVLPVSRAVHPAVYYGLRGAVTGCNVFSCVGIADPEFIHHRERGAVCRGSMAEILFVPHILGF